MTKRANRLTVSVVLTTCLVEFAVTGCASTPPTVEPIPLAVSAEADSALREPCAATIRGAALAGRRVYREKEVDSAANLIFENRGPKYPGVSGELRVEYVVDSSGHADMTTLRPVVPADQALFVSARNFLPSASFKPARLSGHPVAQCVLQSFQFVFAGSDRPGQVAPNH
jgi:hypothetical protein